jgi:glycerol-3-phosphate O-acyltransferase 3/4
MSYWYQVSFNCYSSILYIGLTIFYIRYSRTFGDPYWDTRKGFMYYAYYRMTRWITTVDVVYCEPESPCRGETAVQYSDRVKNVIALSVGLEKVDFNGMAKRDLLKLLSEESKEDT